MPGLNFDQAIAQAEKIGEGAIINVVITSNQDDGIVSYITGNLIYYPGKSSGRFFILEHIATTAANPLIAQFSDKAFSNASKEVDKIGLSISMQGGITANFTVINKGADGDFFNSSTFGLQKFGNLLIGLGGSVGTRTKQAVYTIAFTGVFPSHIP